jgi:predicted ATP-dependent endonuclease of OLD family
VRIETVRIQNFRCFRDISLEFENITTFIGPNGTGKSTVLRALDWFFNGTRTGDLSESDCCHGEIEKDIEVQVSFNDLTTADIEALGKYASLGATSFTAWKKRSTTGEEYVSANAKGFPAFDEFKEASSVPAKREIYIQLRESKPELGLPPPGTGPVMTAAIASWESENTDELVDVPEHLESNFFGFNSRGKMSGLFDFVFVTADLRAGEESQDNKNSIIGRILERAIDRTVVDEEIERIVEESQRAQQEVYREKFETQLSEINDSLNAVVKSYAPGRSIRVSPSPIDLKAPRTTFNVSILDGVTETEVERQGHGFQRTLLISSLQLLAQSGSAETEGVICLAIEEPELFQHPIQALAFAKVLRALADDPGQRIQVTYATHSPYFVESGSFSQIRRLTRNPIDTANISGHSSNLETVERLLATTGQPSERTIRQLDTTIASRLPVALFANRVLLVEGTTEVAVIQGIADRQSIGYLETLGISIVDVAGKTNMPLAHAILASLGIPTYAMFDGDADFEQRALSRGKSPAKIAEERSSQVATNHALMNYFGLVPVDFPPETITESVTILEDTLETLLAREWPEWITSCSRVEDETGTKFEKNKSAYRTATAEAEGVPSRLLEEVIKRSIGL